MKRLIIYLMLFCWMLAGCNAHRAYENSKMGRFEGVVEIRWLRPDRFLFVPNPADPLRFTTAGGQVLEPQPMYTDGGSIPRIFWSVPGYSPWGIGPAYIIHDWLFMAHHCNTSGYDQVHFEDSARIMGETIKTLMESQIVPKNETVFFNVLEAVKSSIAERIWKKGECDLPPDAIVYGTAGAARESLRLQAGILDQKAEAVERQLKTGQTPGSALEAEATAKAFRRRADEARRSAAELEHRDAHAPASELLFSLDFGAVSPGARVK
jgi:hypothetical protein